MHLQPADVTLGPVRHEDLVCSASKVLVVLPTKGFPEIRPALLSPIPAMNQPFDHQSEVLC